MSIAMSLSLGLLAILGILLIFFRAMTPLLADPGLEKMRQEVAALNRRYWREVWMSAPFLILTRLALIGARVFSRKKLIILLYGLMINRQRKLNILLGEYLDALEDLRRRERHL